MVTDENKDITWIRYNHLNLPEEVQFANGDYVRYLYDAAGIKLQKEALIEGNIETTDYLAGKHYKNGVLEFFQHAEGRVTYNSGSFSYEYNLTDHLGNVRVTVDSAGNVLQKDDYYPFGLTFNSWTDVIPENNYTYNGKEEQQEWGVIDYGARMYQADLGRWGVVDPLADNYLSYSPYNYVLNNPLNMIDPDGRSAEIIIDLEAGTITFKSHFVFYGSEANEETKNAALKEIRDTWNQAGLKVDGLKLNFEITGEVVSEKDAEKAYNNNESAANNFVAIESKESSGLLSSGFRDNGNTGILLKEDLNAGGKTAAHEYGHSLGWFSNGQAAMVSGRKDAGRHDYTGHQGVNGRVPGIMTPRQTDQNGPKIIDQRLQPYSSSYLGEDGFIDPSKRSNATQRDINFLNINMIRKRVGNSGSGFVKIKK